MSEKKHKDLTGRRFGRLVVLRYSHRVPASLSKHTYRTYWVCKCDCGQSKIIRSDSLKGGSIQSCGCLQKETAYRMAQNNRTHSLTGSKIFSVYRSMVGRCTNPKDSAYKYYGARGIKVCDEWLATPLLFWFWAISSGYSAGLTLDRIDTNDGYAPSNCKWSTMHEQLLNTRRSVRVLLNGKWVTRDEYSLATGISKKNMEYQIKLGKIQRKKLYS